MKLELDGKAAIVTGGTRGIGRATVLRLLAEGTSVLVCARGTEGLEEIARDASGGRVVTCQADLRNLHDIRTVAARCVAEFGRIDILINNAGSARPGRLHELSDQAWNEDYSLKFFGYVRMVREVLPRMKRQLAGVIINNIGMFGLLPTASYLTGGSADAALMHFTKAIADEGAPYGVRSIGINPGPIDTPRYRLFAMPKDAPSEAEAERLYQATLRASTPLGRPGKPEEVADLIAFLASPRAAFISGTSIAIDGGRTFGGLMN